jgi:hypothetical protein
MAAFTGRNNEEWAGPGNPLGAALFHVYQNNKSVTSLKAAFQAGGSFTVVWFYDPSNAEIAAGATTRQRLAQVFGPKDSWTNILSDMYQLRRTALREGTLYMKGGYVPF